MGILQQLILKNSYNRGQAHGHARKHRARSLRFQRGIPRNFGWRRLVTLNGGARLRPLARRQLAQMVATRAQVVVPASARYSMDGLISTPELAIRRRSGFRLTLQCCSCPKRLFNPYNT